MNHGKFTMAMVEGHLILRNHRLGRVVPGVDYERIAVRTGYEDGSNGMAKDRVSDNPIIQGAYELGYELGATGDVHV